MAMSDEEIEHRLKWLQFDDEDIKRLKELHSLATESGNKVIEELYAHIFGFPETRAFFHDDAQIQQVKKSQEQYFLSLTEGNYGQDYAQSRLRIGATHERVGLDTKWYIGAYCYYVQSFARRIFDAFRHTPKMGQEALLSFIKLIFFDIGLVIDTYIDQREATIRRLNAEAAVLRRILSPEVVDSILAGGLEVKLTTTRKNLTVCFTDIRGFTSLTERLEPEDIVDLLDAYFTEMTKIVFKHGGTLDKYLGDGMMVFFGDPISYDDHPEKAVSAASEMRETLRDLNFRHLNRYGDIQMGAGISTGYVTVGNIGSPSHHDYTVIGTNVNLAARLANMALPGQILVTDRTAQGLNTSLQPKDLGEVTVRGITRPVHVFEIP